MPFIPTVNGASVKIRYTRSGAFWGENTLHFRYDDGTMSTSAVHDLVTAVEVWLTADVTTLFSTEVAVDRIDGRSIEAEEAPYWSEDVNIAGTNASPALPPNVTIAMTLFSGLTGRSKRGRVFLCGLTEASVSSKYILDAYADGCVAAYELLFEALSGSGWVWCILSKYSEGAPRAAGLLTPVEGARFYDHKVDHMDTRLRG